jgi:hypothetical protein
MNKSESIAKLAESLSKAQAIIEGAKKDSANPFFKSKYADLASVWDACRKPLTDNGLSVIQTATFIQDQPELIAIETILAHSSGEWVSGVLSAKPVKSDPQGIGSCVTYLRRYSLAAIAGVSPEDDDGNAASGQGGKVYQLKGSKPEPPKVDGMGEPLPDITEPEIPPVEQPTTFLTNDSPVKKAIEVKLTDYSVNRDQFKAYLMEIKKIGLRDERPSFLTMTVTDASKLLDKWNKTMEAYQKWLSKQSGS